MDCGRNFLQRFGRPLGADSSLNLVVKSIGKRRFMEFVRDAIQIEPDLERIITEWDAMKPILQRQVDLDWLCRAKNVDPAHFVAVVGEAALKFRGYAGILIAALNLPRALTKDGVKDRMKLFEHSGFLPTRKGAVMETLDNVAAHVADINAGGVAYPRFEDTILELEAMRKHEEKEHTARKRGDARSSTPELSGGDP